MTRVLRICSFLLLPLFSLVAGVAASPVLYRLADCEGVVYQCSDSAYLRAWIAGRNSVLPMKDIPHKVDPSVPCACVQRDGACNCGTKIADRPENKPVEPARPSAQALPSVPAP